MTKPTKLKIIQGTARKGRLLPDEFEPEAVNTLDSRLIEHEYEKQEFELITSELAKVGILATIDVSLIEAYCIEAAKYRVAIEMLRKEGVILVGRMGNYINPWHMVSERSFDRMFKIGQSLGFTPTARTKISTKPQAKKKLNSLLDGTGS
jgi:P27 family predicted phage terminase small subunit